MTIEHLREVNKMKYTLTTDDIKVIKRINQRLQYMEDKGYEETNIYKDLQKRILKSGLNLSTSKTGKPRLSRALNQDIKKGLFTVEENLNYIENAKSLSEERKKAKSKDYFEGETVKDRIINKSKFEDRLQEHIDSMYLEAMSGNKYAMQLHYTIKSTGLRKVNYSEIISIMNNIDDFRNNNNPEPTSIIFNEDDSSDNFSSRRNENKQRNKRIRNKKNR